MYIIYLLIHIYIIYVYIYTVHGSYGFDWNRRIHRYCFPNRESPREFLYVKKGGRLHIIEIIHVVTLLGTNNIPTQGMFEDDFPVAKVGYVIVPWRVTIKL